MNKILIALLPVVLLLTACGNEDELADSVQKPPVQEQKTQRLVKVESKKQLLFFMNPNGHPCQVQEQILANMGSDLSDKVHVKFVKTTEMASSRPLFQQYGIRALPTLILLDENGRVEHRMTPGIQSPETISAIL